MKYSIYILFSLLFSGSMVYAQSFTPEKYLGYKIGTRFTPQHTVVNYFKALEANFPKQIKIEMYGKTNENRDLMLAYIGTPENIAQLDQIKATHKKGSSDEKISILWLSYNVHGNEASGTEAAMQTAFELLTKHAADLTNTVVIMDPCLNPDGRDRYVNWYYQYKTALANPNPSAAEHQEPWPGGRPNHYLFDLNRDWAWLTQVESQQRIKKYNEWLPHVHVDFHEQGINEPYYFAPAAEPYHEVITDWQREFQNGMGKNNAKYFDEKGWQYFTSKEFDLLYPSYGDTYPTFCGAIGMTYEQAGNGRAGTAILTNDGDTLTIEERVEHHVITGLSTVEYGSKMTSRLISEQQKFTKEKKYPYMSYVLEGKFEQVENLAALLNKHEIQYSYLPHGQKIKGFNYETQKIESIVTDKISLLVNLNKPKGTLAHVLLEPKTKVADSLTYDITSWSLPYAYGLKAIACEHLIPVQDFAPTRAPKEELSATSYAFIIPWEGMNTARFLTHALNKGIAIRKHAKGFEQLGQKYAEGTLLILSSENKPSLASDLMGWANEYKLQITQTRTGMVEKGSDFGYSDVKLIEKPSVALLIGENTSSLNAGEIWHFLENNLSIPVTLLQESDLTYSSLDEYTTIFVPEGSYNQSANLTEWITNGGKVIAFGDSYERIGGTMGLNAISAEELETGDVDESKTGKKKKTSNEVTIAYSNAERNELSSNVIGSIYNCKLDKTHPINFGIENYYTLRMSSDSWKSLENGFSPVTIEKMDDHMNGFVGHKAAPLQAKSLVVGIQEQGQGKVILFIDNPLFRGFWENGKMLVTNALFQVD